jgi:hypothetical protein
MVFYLRVPEFLPPLLQYPVAKGGEQICIFKFAHVLIPGGKRGKGEAILKRGLGMVGK